MNVRKVVAGAGAAVVVGAGLLALGQFVGGLAFARWQKLPPGTEGILTLRDYWLAFGDVPAVRRALVVCTALSVAVSVAPVIVAALGVLAGRRRELHGSARFAHAGEIRASGLLDEALGRPTTRPGVIVGKRKGRFLVFNGDEFVMLAAPTRSGKGVAVIIPNLLAYPDSVVALDIKGENFDLTSRFRQACGQAVYRWAPFDEHGSTHRWNPLEAIAASAAHQRVPALQRIGARLFHAHDPRHRFFYDAAADLFQAVALYLIDRGERCTLGEVLRRGTSATRKLRDHLHLLANEPGLSADCVAAFARVISAPDETLGSISSTFNTGLRIFSNPIVDAATSACDFDIRQVRRRRMSIYLVLPARDIAVAGMLANLFFAQLIDENMDKAPGEDPTVRHQCLLVLDEFTSMGRIDAINTGNAFIAGYGLRMLTIVQAISQMEAPEVYGKQNTSTLVRNHGLQVVFPPRDDQEAKDVSASLGTFTLKNASVSRSHGLGKGGGSVSVSDQRRPLMLEQELKEMPQHEEIILGRGKPMRCEKAYFYSDPVFVDRLKSVSPMLASLGECLPTREQLDAARQAGELRVNDIPCIDIAAWHAGVNERARVPVTHRPMTAAELLALDQAQASPELLQVVADGLAHDLAELAPHDVRWDVAEILSALGMTPPGRPLRSPAAGATSGLNTFVETADEDRAEAVA